MNPMSVTRSVRGHAQMGTSVEQIGNKSTGAIESVPLVQYPLRRSFLVVMRPPSDVISHFRWMRIQCSVR